jgi:hypothetical protein
MTGEHTQSLSPNPSESEHIVATLLSLDRALANKITSALAVVTGLEEEQFVPIPSKSPSRIRHTVGILKILLLEDTSMPVEDIRAFLGMPAGREGSLLRNAGAFKDRLLLGVSPQHVVDPETTRLQLDTVECMLDLKPQRQLVQLPHNNPQVGIVGGVFGYPNYELVGVTR